MNKPKLILVAGGGAAGKTTYAEKYAAEHPGSVVISADIIRKEAYGREEDHWNENTIYDEIAAAGLSLEGLSDEEIYQTKLNIGNRLTFRLMDEKVEKTLREGHDVIHDSVNRKKDQRARILEKFKGLYGDAELVYLDCPLDVMLERNAKRERHVREVGIKNMYESMEPPTIDEGFTKITIIKVKGDEEK